MFKYLEKAAFVQHVFTSRAIFFTLISLLCPQEGEGGQQALLLLAEQEHYKPTIT